MGKIETKTHHRDSTEADPLWSSLAQYFEATVARYPDHDALIFDDARHTYTSLNEAANQVAKALAAQGITKGDHVGILMANCPTYVACLFGVAKLGAVAVLVNARYKPAELAYIIENADLKLLITHDLISEYANFGDLIREALTIRQTPLLEQLVMQGNPREGFMTWDAFIAGGACVSQDAISALTHATTAFDPCIMMYTSGTTADPKGCPLHQAMLVRNGQNMNRSRYFLNDQDRFWAPLPMFHMASILPILCCIDAGAAVMSTTHFDAGDALAAMERERATVAFSCFPTIMQALIDHPDYQSRDLSAIRRINNSAPPDVLAKFQSAIPQAVQTSAYGLTEAGGVIAFHHPEDSLALRIRTCGQPMPGLEAKVVHPETLEDLPFGEQGEIWLRGYSVFQGYYKAPDKNAESFVDDWFRTGDLCAIEPTGHIQFHGRIKDMLKVGGENVAAIEIESLLSTHPAVKMPQVIGVPDDRLLEVTCAYIELHEGHTATAEELIEFCKVKIASFKVPRHIRFVTEWPMSTTKIQKYVLRANYLEAP